MVVAAEVVGGGDKAVAARVGAPAGVIEMLVGVEAAFLGHLACQHAQEEQANHTCDMKARSNAHNVG